MGLIPNINFTLNGQSFKKDLELLYENEIGTVIYTSDVTTESYVLTNGIPFTSFEMFSRNYKNDLYPELIKCNTTQLIINFKKNIYSASQNRTSITINQNLEVELVMFLNNAMYYCGLRKLLNPISYIYISTSSFIW